MTEQDERVSATLARAADLIEKSGWCQCPRGWCCEHDGDPDCGALCLEGALAAAMGLTWESVQLERFWASAEYTSVAAYLGLDLTRCLDPEDGTPRPREELWRWNDDSCRTEQEVIATLRVVAVIEAAGAA